jgi:DNA-binding transcriptional regulator YhcF (GntR family)
MDISRIEDPQPPAYRPRYERIAELIVEYIGKHQLRAGDRLPTEQEFGEQFGVSRTIVRDAIKMLTPSGVVRPRRGSGIFVGEELNLSSNTPLTLATLVPPEHIGELFDFRCVQEMQTARLARNTSPSPSCARSSRRWQRIAWQPPPRTGIHSCAATTSSITVSRWRRTMCSSPRRLPRSCGCNAGRSRS